jgi:hypothetical protein
MIMQVQRKPHFCSKLMMGCFGATVSCGMGNVCFIISHGETISRSRWTPFVVEARIEPSTFQPAVQRFIH